MVGYEYEISDLLQRLEDGSGRSKVIDSGSGIARNEPDAKRIVYHKSPMVKTNRNWVQLFHKNRQKGLGSNSIIVNGDPIDPPEFVIRPDGVDHYHLWIRIYRELKQPKEATHE